MPEKLTPTPGDVRTEPVATAQQSHVDGRVGPPTIAQDATAEAFVPEGVDQVEPGAVLPADYPWKGGVLPGSDLAALADAVPGRDEPQAQKAGPVKAEHPAATRPARER